MRSPLPRQRFSLICPTVGIQQSPPKSFFLSALNCRFLREGTLLGSSSGILSADTATPHDDRLNATGIPFEPNARPAPSPGGLPAESVPDRRGSGVSHGSTSPIPEERRRPLKHGRNETVKLWNVSTAREVASFDVPWLPSSVGFSLDGRFLVSSSQTTGSNVRVWQALSGSNSTRPKGRTRLRQTSAGKETSKASSPGWARALKAPEFGKNLVSASQFGVR